MAKPGIGGGIRSILEAAHDSGVMQAGRSIHHHGKAREVKLDILEGIIVVADHGGEGGYIAGEAGVRENGASDNLLVATAISMLHKDVSPHRLGDDHVVLFGGLALAHNLNHEEVRGDHLSI